MKDENDIKDYKEYHDGHRIASQIGDVMQGGDAVQEELDEWLNDAATSGEVVERLSSETILTDMCDNFDRKEKLAHSKHLVDTLKKRSSKISRIKFAKIATFSSAAAILALSFLIFNYQKSLTNEPVVTSVISTGVVKSNFVKPTLILNSGKSIDLTAISAINLTNNPDTTSISDTLKYNRIVIPKKFNYSIVLEDGTIVHLNSNSELRYPEKFIGSRREVFLSGEALFEVKKAETPFVVIVNEMEVKVYGTKFNINSYNHDNIQTMLIEGSVSVKTDRDSAEIFIQPNQLLTVNSSGITRLSDVSPERYISWTAGYICNDGEPMSNLLDNIAKWYGVEFIYTQNVKDININASLNRTRPLEEIIKAIETISGLKIIKQEGEKYMIQ